MRWRRALQWLPNGLSAARLAAAVREGTGPPEEGAPPEFLAEEVAAVRESPVRAETEPVP